MMKKLSCTFILSALMLSAAAQTVKIDKPLQRNSRAIGDTLLYMPFPDITVNPTDQPAFMITFEDLDALVPLAPGGPFDFTIYYSTNDTGTLSGYPVQNNFFHPWEYPETLAGSDTAFFAGGTSRFSPPGTADNWFEFGPITIPANGARLYWYDRGYDNRDGYEVLISPSGMINY